MFNEITQSAARGRVRETMALRRVALMRTPALTYREFWTARHLIAIFPPVCLQRLQPFGVSNRGKIFARNVAQCVAIVSIKQIAVCDRSIRLNYKEPPQSTSRHRTEAAIVA